MIDTTKLKAFFKYYSLTPFAIATVGLLLYQLLTSKFPALCWLLWGLLLFLVVREKHYLFLTGRSYRSDHNRYKRPYFELVDYFRDAEPHKLDTTNYPEAFWQNTKGLIFGLDEKNRLVSIPSSSECNLAVFGPPGSGKTAGFAIINAMQFKGSVLAVDLKGDIYSYVSNHSKRRIKRFAPDIENPLAISCRFDPFHGINEMSPTDRSLYIENMAHILVPDEGGSDGNYFTSRARKIFQGVTILILHENPNASFPDVIHAILQGNVFSWVNAAIASDCIEAKELLASLAGSSEKNCAGAYDSLTSSCIHYSNPILDHLLERSDDTISIETLENGCDVYLQISQEHLDTYAPLFTLIMHSFSTAFTKRPDSSTGIKQRPILMLLDEFPQLTYPLRLISSTLSTCRSKGIIVMLLQQSLAQLDYKYQPAGSRSILGNCSYQIILGSNDIQSAEAFSKTFGTKKILRVSNSLTNAETTASGRSVQEAETAVFPPEYFGDLPNKGTLILYAKGQYCELKKLNCYR